MKVLSSIQNNLSGNFYNDQQQQKIYEKNEDDPEYFESDSISKTKNSDQILSSTEQSTLHMFFGTKVPDDMKLYGQNNINQINKGQLLDLRG